MAELHDKELLPLGCFALGALYLMLCVGLLLAGFESVGLFMMKSLFVIGYLGAMALFAGIVYMVWTETRD